MYGWSVRNPVRCTCSYDSIRIPVKNYILYIPAAILALFAGITLFLSTSVIFDLFDMRSREGHFVNFVVRANMAASLLYFAAVYGWIHRRPWTAPVLLITAAMLIATFCAFRIYTAGGGLHETKTFGALIFRIVLTLVFVILAYWSIRYSGKRSGGSERRADMTRGLT